MKSSTLYRLSGVSAIISVVLLLILGIGFLVVGDPNIPQFIGYSLSPGVAHIFFIFVLMGVYFKQFEQMGKLGLIGFALTMMANALFTTGQLSSAYVSFSGSPFGPVVQLLSLGLLILAIANHRAGVLPKWAGWLMFLGHVVNVLTSSIGFETPVIIQIAMFAAGVLWMGVALLLTPMHEA